jgi:hypothetical protein
MTTPLSPRRSDFRRTELSEVVLKELLDGPDCLSGRQQTSVPTVQSKDDRAVFDEVFLPHMAEAYRLAQWLTSNAYDAEDVVQDAALRGISEASNRSRVTDVTPCLARDRFEA